MYSYKSNEHPYIIIGLPQSAVNGFHSGSVLANAIEDDTNASAGDAIISMDGIQVSS